MIPHAIPARRLATIYLALAFPILIALCCLTGPFQVPDEPSHFFRALQIAEGAVLPVPGPDGRSAGGLVDAAAPALVDAIHRDTAAFAADRRFRLDDLADLATDPSAPPRYTSFSNTAIYFPIAHLVPAIAIAAARAAGAPPLAWLYIGRLANALTALAVSALAILLFGDSALFACILCLLPRVLFEQASLSADALVIPFALLFWGLIAALAAGNTPARIIVPTFVPAMLFLCLGKLAYIPLAVLPPAIAFLEGQPRRTTVQLAALSLLTFILWLAWSLAIEDRVFTIGTHQGVVDVHQQLRHVVQAPAAFPAAIANSFGSGRWLLLQDLAGPNIGWIHRPIIPAPIIVLLLASLAAASALPRSLRLRAATRALAAIVILANAVAIYFLLYLQFTPVAAPRVDGVQGRYFFPLIAAAPLLIPGLPRLARHRPMLDSMLLGCAMFGALATLVFVWSSYWRA